MEWPVAGDEPGRACGAAMLEPYPGGGEQQVSAELCELQGNLAGAWTSRHARSTGERA